MKHPVVAMLLLAVAAQARARITDNFLDEVLECDFRTQVIFELSRQNIPITKCLIGGAVQFGKDIDTSTVDIAIHETNKENETLFSIPLSGDKLQYYKDNKFLECPMEIRCRFYFVKNESETPKGQRPRAAFLKGDTFLIEKVEVILNDAGQFLHRFTLSEADRTSDGIKPMPRQREKTFVTCLSPVRLKQWSLLVGFNNYLYPCLSKEDKETLARSPLPDVPREFGGPENLMGCLVASPWSAWRVGVEAEGRPPEIAIAKYTEGIQANPKDAWSRWKRANAYRKKKDFPSAIRDLGEVIRLAEAEKDAGGFVIEMFNTRGLWRRDEMEDRSGSIADFDEVIGRAQVSGGEIAKRWGWTGYVNRGISNRCRGEFTQSIRDFDKALTLPDGKNAIVFRSRGQTYFDIKDFDSAIRDFTEAIHMDSQYADAYYGRSACYSWKSDFEDALRDVNRAIELDGKNPWYYTNRAIILKGLGRTSEAAADRRKAEELQ